MGDLLDEVLDAYGGAERWRSIVTITARGQLGGLLPKRFPGSRLSNFAVEVTLAEQRTVLHDFPRPGQRAVFDHGEARIETSDGEAIDTRTDPRSAFFGLSGIRRNVRWDPLDTTYFAGYAFWNYLTAPHLLTHHGVTVTDGGPCQQSGRQWRRLLATFPADINTHCRQQTFYVDADGLIGRHDFLAEPVGSWANAALLCSRYRCIDGIPFATRRRVFPRGPGGSVLSWPTLLALDFDEIEISH
ncbi:hypothetical protein ACTXG7_11070 [Mycolicibacterium sp. Dal123E01]|uniref:hypothetical protein n=1 Tax=Mycolicibacterium sp. Dal123E01 TaxID=3457578 RepID=UPI00403EA8CF